MRPPNLKIYRQTSIHEYFYSKEEPEESSNEEEPEFIVEDVSFESEDDETVILEKNFFEEDDENKNDDNFKTFCRPMEELEIDELDFVIDDGSFNLEKFHNWMNCPVCDDNCFKNKYLKFIEV